MRYTFAALALAGSLVAGCGSLNNASADDSKKGADTQVTFDQYPSGALQQIVRGIWMKDPEYKDYVAMFNEPPSFQLGVADLNNDGVLEVFARHSDSEYGLCTDRGICRLHIYAKTDKGLVEVGRMMAGEPVTLTAAKTNGVRNLVVYGTDEMTHTYLWDGKKFKPQ